MDCQTCNVELEAGTLQSKTSFFSTSMPASYDDQKWAFVHTEGKKEKLELSLHDRQALKCPQCGLIAIPGNNAG